MYEIPKKWYTIQAVLETPLPPPRHPATGEPITPEDLAPLFAKELISQEVTIKKYITIPEAVRDVYTMWRPPPLYRARRLEAYLKTPAHLPYKYEGVSPPTSHKPNTAVARAYCCRVLLIFRSKPSPDKVMVKLTNKKIRWTINQVVKLKKSTESVAHIYGVSQRRTHVVKMYTDTGDITLGSRLQGEYHGIQVQPGSPETGGLMRITRLTLKRCERNQHPLR